MVHLQLAFGFAFACAGITEERLDHAGRQPGVVHGWLAVRRLPDSPGWIDRRDRTGASFSNSCALELTALDYPSRRLLMRSGADADPWWGLVASPARCLAHCWRCQHSWQEFSMLSAALSVAVVLTGGNCS